MMRGSRRKGFELLRDVITRHRQWWASQCLDRYLRARWQRDLTTAARQFHVHEAAKGKPPTLKQFAKDAVRPASRWFGGDISMLASSLGLKLAVDMQRAQRMPRDRRAFARTVLDELRRSTGQSGCNEAERAHHLQRLAAESVGYVQLWEALGRPPSRKELGAKFDWASKALSVDVDIAWEGYAAAIERSRARFA